MPSPLRVFETWFALHLTVGVLAAITGKTLVSVTYSAALLIGSFVALLASVGLLHANPDLDIGRLWRIGHVALALAVLASVVGVLLNVAWLGDVELAYPVAVGFAALAELASRRR